MTLKASFIVLTAFILGVFSTLVISNYYGPDLSTATASVVAGDSSDSHFITRILGITNPEQPSPYNWVSERDITVEKDKVTIDVSNAQWSRFTNTNSMDPVLDNGANAIQIVPKSEAEIHVGDIVSYKSEYLDGTVIHRVIETGYDKQGWYAIMKGDNNSREDPGKIRFNQIKRITIAVIY